MLKRLLKVEYCDLVLDVCVCVGGWVSEGSVPSAVACRIPTYPTSRIRRITTKNKTTITTKSKLSENIVPLG